MNDFLTNSLQLLLKGKLFRDAVYAYGRLALINIIVIAVILGVFGTGLNRYLILPAVILLGVFVPYFLRNLKYQ